MRTPRSGHPICLATPVLGEQCRTLVDDRRGTLDASVRLAATMTGTAVAWEIDSPSPALPLPFIRERMIWVTY